MIDEGVRSEAKDRKGQRFFTIELSTGSVNLTMAATREECLELERAVFDALARFRSPELLIVSDPGDIQVGSLR